MTTHNTNPKNGATAPLSVRPLSLLTTEHGEQPGIPHRHQSFEIIWVTSGTGRLSIDLNKVDLTSGTAYFISPGQMHSIDLMGNAQGYVVSFTSEFISHQDASLHFIYENGLMEVGSHPAVITIPQDTESFMRETIDRMLREVENVYLMRREVLLNLLKLFLLDLSRQMEKKEPVKLVNSRNLDLVKRFLILLDQNYLQRKPVLFYADELHVTPNYLNEIVKRVSGFPASHHIQQRVILEAKRQAAFALSSMKEVAINLGFDDFAHFSRFFKKNAGMNFTEFKREIQGIAISPATT
ncbi:MAG: helix-turn-helix domain-containing protein [Cyclobacteriaceae bacterium]|nr:helix-turn-helix domain-containing protein [Cyclobacteriaceae bacterium]